MQQTDHPIRLAVNYSEPAARLLREGRLAFDRFKCPDWPAVIEAAGAVRPPYVHFPLQAGQLGGAPVDLEGIAALRTATGTPFVNIHLDPHLAPDLSEAAARTDAVDRSIRDVRSLTTRFGAAHIVAENIPFWPDRPLHAPLAADPAFIGAVVEAAGCGFLLDLAHARIAARSLGMDARAYLARLPVRHLRELHLTGVGLHEGWFRDHLPLSEEDWDVYTWALHQIREGAWGRPRIIALEYGGVGPRFAWRTDPDVIARQVPRFCALARTLLETHPAPPEGRSVLPA